MKLVLALASTAFASIPEQNEPTIRELVEQLSKIEKPWKSGFSTKFAPDSKPSDHKYLNGVLSRDPSIQDLTNPSFELNPTQKTLTDSLPTEFDPRTQWGDMCPSLNHIVDQGTCASCWSMSAVTAFSDRACIQTGGQYTQDFSCEDILECCSGCGHGCDGGYLPQTWSQLVTKGTVSGGLYQSEIGCKPYAIPACEHYNVHPVGPDDPNYRPDCHDLPKSKAPSCIKECTNPEYLVTYDDDKVHLDKYYGITNHKVSDIQTDLMNNGPIQTSMNIYEDFLTYASGVFVHTTGRSKGSHAVKLMGWGVDEETGLDYWLVANSWGADWGEDGWFRIKKGVNMAGIEGSMYAGNMAGWSG
jgi:cathepsin B